jgi:hypothetical protein
MKYLSKKRLFKPLHVFFLILLLLVVGISLYFIPKSENQDLRSSAGILLNAPSISPLSSITETKMYFNDDTGRLNAEVTPISLGTKQTGGWYTFLVTTAETQMCTTPSNIFSLSQSERLDDRKTCKVRTLPSINNQETANTPAIFPLWKRDYYGVMSAHLLKDKNNQMFVYSINHGESKNRQIDSVYGITKCVPVADMGYGTLPCDSRNDWGSYNAWISMSSMPWTLTNLNSNRKFTDLGPILWPSNGYIESKVINGKTTWVKATDGGIRHPSSIIHEGYIYVYYEDLSQGLESEGRGPGIKVARAPIINGKIDPRNFKNYYKGSYSEPSLPAGFTLDKYYNSLAAKGGRSSSIFTNYTKGNLQAISGTKRTDKRTVGNIFSFTIAKVKGTNKFLSVTNDLNLGVAIRQSTDLVTWSAPYVVPGTQANWWNTAYDFQTYSLLYPRFLNQNGDTNTEIDASAFYVIGTQTKNKNGVDAKIVNSIKLKLNL